MTHRGDQNIIQYIIEDDDEDNVLMFNVAHVQKQPSEVFVKNYNKMKLLSNHFLTIVTVDELQNNQITLTNGKL